MIDIMYLVRHLLTRRCRHDEDVNESEHQYSNTLVLTRQDPSCTSVAQDLGFIKNHVIRIRRYGHPFWWASKTPDEPFTVTGAARIALHPRPLGRRGGEGICSLSPHLSMGLTLATYQQSIPAPRGSQRPCPHSSPAAERG